nr:hypothetical protein Iba_chr15aCG11660 [Ipomoea batatas]
MLGRKLRSMKWLGNVAMSWESQPNSPPLAINAGIYRVGGEEQEIRSGKDEVSRFDPTIFRRLNETRVLKNVVPKISSEFYEYWIFWSLESVKEAGLEPPDYGRAEKYGLREKLCYHLHLPKKPRPKVTLGGGKAAPLTAAATEQPIPTGLSVGAAYTTAAASDHRVV